MLRILGGPKRLCDGLTRRDLLHVGSLGLIGLGLREWSSLSRASASDALPSSSLPGFGQAKACILLFMYGSPSQLETFDPKPEAPAGDPRRVRLHRLERAGRWTSASGCPGWRRSWTRSRVIRSVSHPYPIHGVAYATTGIPRIDIPMELNPRDPSHWPFIGSVGRLHRWATAARARASGASIPRNLVLPWAFSSQRVGEVARAGPYGGFLGQAYDPICTEFVGRATRTARKTLAEQGLGRRRAVSGHHAGEPVPAGRRSKLSAGADPRPPRSPPDPAGAARAVRRAADRCGTRPSGIDRHRAMAYDLLGSARPPAGVRPRSGGRPRRATSTA